jgi:hypothetical protein
VGQGEGGGVWGGGQGGGRGSVGGVGGLGVGKVKVQARHVGQHGAVGVCRSTKALYGVTPYLPKYIKRYDVDFATAAQQNQRYV